MCCKGVEIDSNEIADHRFYINTAIGGRFSSTSVIGTCILGLCFGIDSKYLNGAKSADANALSTDFEKNLALQAAWSTIWYRNIKL